MGYPVDVVADFPFHFCQRCTRMEPVAVDHTLYAFDEVAERTITVGCANADACKYIKKMTAVELVKEAGGDA